MMSDRYIAYQTLMDIEMNSAYSNLALNERIKKHKPKSPPFVRQVVYGVLENMFFLDYIIDNLAKSGIKKIKTQDKILLRMGIYQIAYMDVPEYAAVNETVTIARKVAKGRDGFINGVLRGFLKNKDSVKLPERSEDEIKYLSIKYSCSPWIVELWDKQYGLENTEAMLAKSCEAATLSLRVNTTKNTVEQLMRHLKLNGVETETSKFAASGIKIIRSQENTENNNQYSILDSDLYRDGMFSVQDDSSMKTIEILDPKEGELIVDMCAAPGGKTMAIAEKMNNKGKVIARDIYPAKIEIIKQEAERLGLGIVDCQVWDGQEADSSLANKVDRVLADVPCSGLGVIGRKPEIKLKKSADETKELPKIQLKILSVGAKYVKLGGVLQYSTCTLNKEENEEVVKKFVENNSEFVIEEEKQFFPHIDYCDGFYVCKMVKKY